MTPNSNYPCHTMRGHHSWPGDFDVDGWQRCQNGCGAGRPRLGRWPGEVYAPTGVPPLGEAPMPESPQTRPEPVLCVSFNGWHSWPIHLDSDGWARCQRLGCGAGRRGSNKRVIPPELVPAYQEPAELEDDDDTWTPLPTYVPLEPREASNCARCGARELVERDFDGDVEFVCVNGHRRYGRSSEQLAALVAEDARIRDVGVGRNHSTWAGGIRLS